MKTNIKFYGVLIIFLCLSNLGIGQSFIGSSQIIQSGGDYYLYARNDYIPFDTKNIIIQFYENTTETSINAFEQQNNLNFDGEYDGFYIYKLPSNIEYISFCQNLEQNSIVKYIEVSLIFKLAQTIVPNEYNDNDHWYFENIGMPETWAITTGSESVVVAVLDTGLDFEDEEFGHDDWDGSGISHLFQNDGEDPWDFWWDPSTQGNNHPDGEDGPDDNSYIDDWQGLDVFQLNYDDDLNFIDETIDNDVTPQFLGPEDEVNYCIDDPPSLRHHGSVMSSIIAAKSNNDYYDMGMGGGDVVKNKSGLKILPIKVADWANISGCFEIYFHTPAVVKALSYAREMQVDVINMSFEAPLDNQMFSINNQLSYAYDEGIVLVGSAGNDGWSGGSTYPAFNSHVISVGAIDENENRANFSAYGKDLELVAPGTDISSWKINYAEGTSFSTAMVSGTAALMRSVNPNIANWQIRNILRETTYKNDDYDFTMTDNWFYGDTIPEEWNNELGFGRVNTLAAVCAAIDLIPEYIITTNETWDRDTYSRHNITIEPGASLTLTADLKMDPSSKIIVKRGAKLIVNGGTITNLANCSGDQLKWQGIEVWGNPNHSQQADANGDYEQGYLELNNATIAHAKTAVALRKEGTWAEYGGGIIKAYNSNFINNEKSVWFAPYENMVTIGPETFEADNEALFRDCLFEINGEYFPDSDFYKHADVVEVRGIEFLSCDFKRLANENTSAQCAAIACYSAGIKVNDYQEEASTFEGLYYGVIINYNNVSGTYSSFVSNSIFTNNSIGIKLNPNTNIVSIKNNVFNVGYNEPDKGICGTSQGFGIYLNNSNTFIIEDNAFNKYAQAPADGVYIGIEANNTQTGSDEIFRNSFQGLTHANHATDQNWLTDEYEGLEYYCNEHSNNNNDLFFTFKNNQNTSGVQRSQGNNNNSTGNVFTNNINGYNLYNNTSFDVDYYYNVAENSEIPFSYTAATINPKPQILVAGCNDGTDIKGLTDAEKQAMESDYTNAEADYNSVKSLYQSLNDGGNTEVLKTEVSSSWPDDMWELREELLGLSPYLSTDVLKTAADKTEVLPESILFEILAANPDELKKEELMAYLENKEEPLPDYMISILRQLADGETAKTIMLNDMARYNRQKSRIARQMLVSLPFEAEADAAEYRLWLSRLEGMHNDRKIVASLIAEGKTTDALALANLFPELYALENQALNEHEYYMDMLSLDIDLKSENRSPAQLNSSEMALVEQIAQNSQSYAGAQARGLLEHFYGLHFCECANTIVDENKSMDSHIEQDDFAKAMGLNIKTEPNPASSWVAFNYQLPLGSEHAELLIKALDGKHIAQFRLSSEQGQEVWDSRNIKAGTYIYELVCGELKQTGKIIIVK